MRSPFLATAAHRCGFTRTWDGAVCAREGRRQRRPRPEARRRRRHAPVELQQLMLLLPLGRRSRTCGTYAVALSGASSSATATSASSRMLPSHAGRRCNRRRRLQLLMLLLLLLPSNGILLLLFLQTPKCPLRTPHLPLLRQARRPCLLRVPGARHASLRVLVTRQTESRTKPDGVHFVAGGPSRASKPLQRGCEATATAHGSLSAAVPTGDSWIVLSTT